MNSLRIIGAGGHGRVLADIAEGMGYRDIAFLDAGYPKLRESGAWPVTGTLEAQDEADVALGIGDNATRLSFFETLTQAPVTLIHPSAVVSPHAEIGAGSVICAGAVVAPFAKLGQGCIINTCASIDHDCVLSDGVHISPGARLGGGVFVGARTWIGIGAVVREYKSIGSDVMIGAGAAVIRNVADGARMGGVPAKEF